jgi:hypothetical protein
MDEQKLKQFNEELVALLTKYNVNLQVNQGIVVVPNKPMEENTPVVEEVAPETAPEVAEEAVA